MAKRSEISPAQRREIVLKVLRREEPIGALARRHGLAETTLHRWREDFLKAGQAAMTYGRGKGAGDKQAERINHLEKELVRRDQVIGELTIANRILKKTADGSY